MCGRLPGKTNKIFFFEIFSYFCKVKITTHTEFYGCWKENRKTIDRIDLIIRTLDTPGIDARNILRIDKDGNKCGLEEMMPEIVKILNLARTHQKFGIHDTGKIVQEYDAWVREENRKKNLIELLEK